MCLVLTSGTGYSIRGLIPGEEWFTLPQKPLIACNALSTGGALLKFPSTLACQLVLSSSGLIYRTIFLRFPDCSFPVIYKRHKLQIDYFDCLLTHYGDCFPLLSAQFPYSLNKINSGEIWKRTF